MKNHKSTLSVFWSILFPLLTVLWLGFIFGHSMQSAEGSTVQSDWIAALLSRVLFWVPSEQVLSATALIRKCAHLIEFTVLGILISIDAEWFDSLRRKGSLVLLTGILCAMCDETIQLFSPGRSSEVRDVWIDFSGVLLGTLSVCLILFIVRKIRERNP